MKSVFFLFMFVRSATCDVVVKGYHSFQLMHIQKSNIIANEFFPTKGILSETLIGFL